MRVKALLALACLLLGLASAGVADSSSAIAAVHHHVASAAVTDASSHAAALRAEVPLGHNRSELTFAELPTPDAQLVAVGATREIPVRTENGTVARAPRAPPV